MNLSGEKDLGLKTSDLGLTSDIGRSLKWEARSRVSGAGNKSS